MQKTTTLRFTIIGPPRTKKNHGRRVYSFRQRRSFSVPSEAYEQYERDSIKQITGRLKRKIAEPVNVKAIYYCDANRRVDLNGLNQALHDMLVKAEVLADDSAVNPAVVVSTDGTRAEVDRRNPRTEVEITAACL